MKKLERILDIIFDLLVLIVLIYEFVWTIKYSLTAYIDEAFELMTKMIMFGVPTLTVIALRNGIINK